MRAAAGVSAKTEQPSNGNANKRRARATAFSLPFADVLLQQGALLAGFGPRGPRRYQTRVALTPSLETLICRSRDVELCRGRCYSSGIVVFLVAQGPGWHRTPRCTHAHCGEAPAIPAPATTHKPNAGWCIRSCSIEPPAAAHVLYCWISPAKVPTALNSRGARNNVTAVLEVGPLTSCAGSSIGTSSAAAGSEGRLRVTRENEYFPDHWAAFPPASTSSSA